MFRVCVRWQVLAAAGAVNHEELVKQATEAFGAVPDEEPGTSLRSLIAKVGFAVWGRRFGRCRGGAWEGMGGQGVVRGTFAALPHRQGGFAARWAVLGGLGQGGGRCAR